MSISDDGRDEVAAVAPTVDDDPTRPFGFPVPPAPPRRSHRKVWLSLLAAVLAVVVLAVGYTAVRFLVDRGTYNDGHEAYQRADCAAAVGHFDDVISAWRIVELGDTRGRAESEKAECLVFDEAAKRQQAGNSSGALAAYVLFLPGRPPSPLVDAARTRVGELFKQPEPAKLVTVESCDTLPLLRDQKLLDLAVAPTFLAACGSAFVHGSDRKKAQATYARLFAEFSTDKVAAQTEAALMADASWCPWLSELRSDPVFSALKDLIPGLLLTCAKAPNVLPRDAILYMDDFLKKFPGHRFTPDALTTLAAMLNKESRAGDRGHDFGKEDLIGPVGGDKAVIMLYNDSPEKLRFALSGAEPRVEEVEPCADCSRIPAGQDPGACRKQATSKRIVIAPGEYDMATNYPDSSRTHGGFAHWNLQAGKAYFACFYIEGAA